MNGQKVSKKEIIKDLKQANKIMQEQLNRYEEGYLRQKALINHLKRIFIYELNEDKWNDAISYPLLNDDLAELQEKQIEFTTVWKNQLGRI